MPTWIEEGTWECSQCQAVNEGRNKVCVGCGSPLESDERISFAASPSYAQRVTDPALVVQFSAGPDWECPYCQGKQRNDRGECVNCGGAKANTPAQDPDPSPQQTPAESSWSGDRHPRTPRMTPRSPIRRQAIDNDSSSFISSHTQKRRNSILAIVAVCVAVLVGVAYILFRTTEKELTVGSVQWTRTIAVERYRLMHQEGFDTEMPGDAQNVQSLGTRHHHYREYQCGTQQESYQVQEACGQDCRTTPVRCRDNQNGSRTCSGGDRVCSTKYCPRTKTKTFPKMCEESIRRPYSSWDVWRWGHARNVVANGTSVESVRWPGDAELQIGVGCQGAERERTDTRSEVYAVVFRDGEGDTYTYSAKSEQEFRTLSPGSAHQVMYSIAGGVRLNERR